MQTVDIALDHGPRRKAQVSTKPDWAVIKPWLLAGFDDFRANRPVSLIDGAGLVLLGWAIVIGLIASGMGWMILPALAGAVLVGPVATVGLYQISRRGLGVNAAVATPGQIFLVGVVMMMLVLLWIRPGWRALWLITRLNAPEPVPPVEYKDDVVKWTVLACFSWGVLGFTIGDVLAWAAGGSGTERRYGVEQLWPYPSDPYHCRCFRFRELRFLPLRTESHRPLAILLAHLIALYPAK